MEYKILKREKNKKKLTILQRLAFLLVIAVMFSTVAFVGKVEAKGYKKGYSYSGKVKVGKYTFKGSSGKIIIIKNGKKKATIKNVDSTFLTNGKTVYYTKKSQKVYSYNIKTKKKKYLFKVVGDGDTFAFLENAKGNYIYYTKNFGPEGSLYVYNLKKKKKTAMTSYGPSPGSVKIKGTKVYVTRHGIDIGSPVEKYVFSLSGKMLKHYYE